MLEFIWRLCRKVEKSLFFISNRGLLCELLLLIDEIDFVTVRGDGADVSSFSIIDKPLYFIKLFSGLPILSQYSGNSN